MAEVTLQLPDFLGRTPTAFTCTAPLSGVIYRLRFWWDNRASGDAGAWRVDLRTATGAPVLLALKLVLIDDLWGKFHACANVPPGALRVSRVDGEADPGLYDLAGAVTLEYVT